VSVSAVDLAAVPLFDSLDESEREEVATWFDVKIADKDVRLVGEGSSGYSFFVLVSGSAVVTSAGVELGTLSPGDFFGEVAILGGGRRTASVTTTSPSTLFTLFGTDFRKLQQTHPQIADRIEAAMRDRLTNGA